MGVRERSRYVFDENDEPLSSSKMSEKSKPEIGFRVSGFWCRGLGFGFRGFTFVFQDEREVADHPQEVREELCKLRPRLRLGPGLRGGCSRTTISEKCAAVPRRARI